MKFQHIRSTSLGLLLSFLILSGCGGGNDSGDFKTTSKIPAAPTDISATVGINQVTLAWNAVSGADSYNIYWSDKPGVTPATGTRISVGAGSYTHQGLLVSQSYYYVVTAVNSAGESLPSTQAVTVSTNNGINLYTTHCGGCHGGEISATTIKNGTVHNIKTAIANNTGGMGVLSHLTDEEVNTITSRLPCH
jgi:mono/diheme cytochrome c family protein